MAFSAFNKISPTEKNNCIIYFRFILINLSMFCCISRREIICVSKFLQFFRDEDQFLLFIQHSLLFFFFLSRSTLPFFVAFYALYLNLSYFHCSSTHFIHLLTLSAKCIRLMFIENVCTSVFIYVCFFN